ADAVPWLEPALRWGGAAFLAAYGARSLMAARRPRALDASGGAARTLRGAVLTALALTWLNPHVYLDTLALLGALAAAWPVPQRWAFGAGAVAASFAFFFSLGYGARLLAPLFARPGAWRALDAGVGVLMWLLAAGLLLG
ncbi:MAG: LysE/ArgO family amino acid transporter, partial [Rubrimonas sp.]